MAQLVKLQDYISRYQVDLAKYPTQFVRLKRVQWQRVKEQWESGGHMQEWQHIDPEEEPKETGRFNLFRKIFKSKQEESLGDVEEPNSSTMYHEVTEEIPFEFEANILHNPQNLHDLKRMFMDQFFHFQLKWASSTLREKSYVDPRFMRDTLLRSFVQNLPDNYLLFYYPIVKMKNAPIELDLVLITPTECICITVVEEEEQAVYVANGERFWAKKVGKLEKKRLNPMIQLNRMEAIVKQLFQQADVDLPIKKVLLSRNGYFDSPGNNYNVQLIDKRKFQEWMIQLKRTSSPIKHMQIRAAQAVLQAVETTSFNRDIWASEQEEQS